MALGTRYNPDEGHALLPGGGAASSLAGAESPAKSSHRTNAAAQTAPLMDLKKGNDHHGEGHGEGHGEDDGEDDGGCAEGKARGRTWQAKSLVIQV